MVKGDYGIHYYTSAILRLMMHIIIYIIAMSFLWNGISYMVPAIPARPYL